MSLSTGIIGQVTTTSLLVAPDGSPGSVPLTLRPLVSEDASALQEMLDDPGVREVMGWREDEYRDAGLIIERARPLSRSPSTGTDIPSVSFPIALMLLSA